ncbi:DUF3108 domain-containing protein [Litorilinea aerophila]|uniref:DUF3108 domain-containing protein n=1 Tax=Litorilinea aerophila TaxID=1204385 RepID=A0A540VAH6_9CHLR|nr:DUF3108 domain-containing protein [Litorilinea aerophila]MCC9078441.1 DUF3108 domain-containing protein [Litorilinea aerophila]
MVTPTTWKFDWQAGVWPFRARNGRPFWLLWLVTLLALAGCNEPTIQPLRFNEAPWQAGEVSTYRITDLNDNYAGTARFDILARPEGGWTIRREISAQGVQEIVTVDVGDKGLRPARTLMVRVGDDGQEEVETIYASGQVDLRLTTKQDVTTYQRVNVPSDVRDVRTLPLLARTLPLEEGYATRLNSFLPVSATLDRVTLEVLKRETVQVPAGTFDTWLVEIQGSGRKTRLWIGVEPPHLLVKFVDGHSQGTFELTQFEAGKPGQQEP